jgi:uncharacterized protein YndB with AHSA1/START domain
MTLPFSIEDEIDVDATPDQVWDAITVGPRLDSWFMGRSEIEPRAGGTIRTDFDGFAMESTVTVCEPSRRFVYRGEEGPDGAYMEFGWRIEPRAGGGSTVHFTHRGRLGGDDAQTEYEALKKGDPMYLRKLGHYLEFFNGQTATHNVAAYGPQAVDGERFWSTLKSTLGLGATVREWDAVRATVDGVATIDGVVDYVTPEFLGVRTSTGMYRFIHGLGGAVVVEHHDFGPRDNGHANSEAWQSWLSTAFA